MIEPTLTSSNAYALATDGVSHPQLIINELTQQLTAERDQFKVMLDKANDDIAALQAKLLFVNEKYDSDSALSTVTLNSCKRQKRKIASSSTNQQNKKKSSTAAINVSNYFSGLDNEMDTVDSQLTGDRQPSNSNKEHSVFTRSEKPTANLRNKSANPKKAIPSKLQIQTQQSQAASSSSGRNNVTEGVKKCSPPPPIVAFNLDHKQCIDRFPKIIGNSNFTINKVSATCSHIKLDTLPDYRKIMDTLKEDKACFHTFTPKDERKTGLILRNLCASFDANDILQALEELKLNIKVHSVTPYRTEYSQRNGQTLDLWHIQLDPGSDDTSLLKTTRLLYQSVRFERRKHGNSAQCYNCQNFGHSASNCFRPYRCVKCTNNHKPGDCPLPMLRENSAVTLNPSCVNCGEAHSANFRGCKVYKQFINKRQIQTLPVINQVSKNAAYNNFATSGVSYAAAVGKQRNPLPQQSSGQSNCLEFIEAECNEQFGINFTELIKKTAVFVPKYITLKPEDKQMALLKFIMSITPNLSV